MKRPFWLALILVVLVGVSGFSPLIFKTKTLAQANPLADPRLHESNLLSPKQQATPEPTYLPGQLLLDVSVALDKCFDGTISWGFVPCGSPSGTDPIPWDISYPQTIQYFDFSLSTDAYLGFETHLVITDEFFGELGIRLQQWNDTSGSWVQVDYDGGTGTYNNRGDISGNFDPDWTSKVEYNSNRTIHPAGKYRIMVWEEVNYWNGDTRGYKPSQGSIKIYAFENTPPPAIPAPNPELTIPIPPDPAITDTPAITPTSAPADLSIEDAVYVLQAIDGANYVALRDIGVLVRPYWKGLYPENIPTGYQFQVTLTFDGIKFQPQTKGPGRDFTWVIPGYVVGASDHTINVQAEIVGVDIVDSDPSNNTFNKTFKAYASRPLRLLYVRVKPTNVAAPSMAALNKLARDSISYLRQVYPVHFVRRVPGNYQVWTFTDTRYAVSLAVAKTLLRYNNERCLKYLPDGRVQQKVNCTAPEADLAVAAIPINYYGDGQGWLYGRGSKTWAGAVLDKTSQGLGWATGGGASLDRAAITLFDNWQNPAHEIGHHFDLEDEYSDDLGKQIKYGFIWQDGIFKEIAAQKNVDGERIYYYNFMGNAGVGQANEYWVNADTWNHILNRIISTGQVALPSKAASLQPVPLLPSVLIQTDAETFGPALLVSGTVNQAGQGRIDSVDRLHRYEVFPGDQGLWILEALDSSGGILGGIRFDSYPTELDSEVPFLVTLPISDPAAVAKIQLRTDSGIATTFDRSPAAPGVSVTTLPDVSQSTATLAWSAQDSDGDATTSTVYYSPDDGATWHALAQDTSETQVQFDPATIPGGEVQFRIVTSDGFNETTTLLAPITIPEHAPTASIATPAGVDFIHGDAVLLQGYADDPEDGTLPDENLHWFDGNNQEIGTGPLLFVQLPVGQHTLTLQAVDSAGQYGTSSVDITVQAGTADNGAGNGTGVPVFNLPANSLFYLLGGGACVLMLMGSLLVSGVFLLTRGRKQIRMPEAVGQAGTVQDQQGNWWVQDPRTGRWNFWNGRSWQAAPGTVPNIAMPISTPPSVSNIRDRKPGISSCLFTIVALVILGLLVVSGISLVAFNFFPGAQIQTGQGDLTEFMKKGGGGLLVTILGMFLLNGGFKSIFTRRAVVTDEWGRRREKRGCSAILNGLGQLFFGVICLSGGLGLITLAFYQEIIPWLGF